MDSSSLNSENESLSEVKMLRQQLNTYKMINADLSKKVQGLNVELSIFKKEIAKLRSDYQEEHEKVAGYRQYIKEMNTKFMNFFNSYVNALDQLNENDETFLREIPELLETPKNKTNADNPALLPQIERPKRPETVRPQLHNELNGDENDVLNTILEESNPSPFTSTPIVSNRASSSYPALTPVPKHSLQSLTDISSDKSMETTSYHVPLAKLKYSKNNFLSPTNNKTVIETPRMQVDRSSRRISINPVDNEGTEKNETIKSVTKVLRQEPINNKEDIIEYPDNENETANQHNLMKSVRVALSPLSSIYLKNNNNDTNSSDYKSFDDETTMASTQSTLTDSRAKKRKSSENIRPRRKARPDPNVLREPSLKTKLRSGRKKNV